MKVICTALFTVLQTFNLCVHQPTKIQRKKSGCYFFWHSYFYCCYYFFCCCFLWHWLRILATKSQPRGNKDYKNDFNKATEDGVSISSSFCATERKSWKDKIFCQGAALNQSWSQELAVDHTGSYTFRGCTAL